MEINSASNLYNSFDSASVGKYESGNVSEKAGKKASEAAHSIAEDDAFTPSPKDGNAADTSLSVKSADLFKAVHNSAGASEPASAQKETETCYENGESSESAK